MDSNRLYRDLIRDEGKKLEAYRDSMGLWTIGVGHLLGAEKRMIRITEEESRALFDVDIEEAEALARSLIPLFPLLDDVRQRALVNMAFNRGGHMRTSTTITPAIVRASGSLQDWAKVTVAIKASQWATQVGKRAERLAYMLETGKDPL